MTDRSAGPRCGNNPNTRLTPGDRKAVDDFKARLALQAAAKPYIADAVWVDFDPLMEVIASTLWEHCGRDSEDMPQLVCDDPRTIAAFATAVARAHAASLAPATDQAVLRDRIAVALEQADYRPDMRRGDLADAIMPVLPAPADRAAVLREEAALIRAHCPDHLDSNSAEGSWTNCHCDVADDMDRRLAAESAPADTAHDDSETEGDALRCVCGETAVRSGDSWVHEPGKGGTCLYRPKARPRCPDCQTPHDLTSGGMAMRACASILASLADRAAAAQQPKEAEDPRTVCVCGHTRGEHLVVSGRLLCDECDPDSTDNLVCKEFEAL